MLEEPNQCSLCGVNVRGYVGGVPVYWCPRCYKKFTPDIMERTDWAVYLLGLEKARRKRRNRLIKGIGLPVFVYGIPPSGMPGAQ